MNQLQVVKNGYVRCMRLAISALFVAAGVLLQWLEPAWLAHPFFFAAAAVFAYQVLREAFIALGYKKIIAKVHGHQPFFRTFFAGESLEDLRTKADGARRDMRDLRAQAIRDCGYSEKEFERLFRKHGYLETAEILMKEHITLERECRKISMRGDAAGIGPLVVQDMLVRYGTDETKARIEAVERGVLGGLSVDDMLQLLHDRGLARTWVYLEDFGLHAGLLDAAEKIGSRDVVLSAIKQLGYQGGVARYNELAKKTGHPTFKE